VALAVTGIGVGALWIGLSQAIVVTDRLPERVIARWVAQNRLVLRQARGEWPPTREFRGTTRMDGRTWYWREKIESTGEPLLRRITVDVSSG